MRFRIYTLVLLAVLGVVAAPALASTAESGGGTSFVRLIIDGAEAPGLVIGLMSVASLTIIVSTFLNVRRSTILPADELETTRRMVEQRQFRECIDYLRDKRSMFSDVLTASLRHGRHGFDAMHEAAEERTATISSRLFRGVEYLNIIGNLGPLMGLLGTVLGMIKSFSALGAAHGAAKPEALAEGISLALVNTFLGLLVAIVSLGMFGVLRNQVDKLTIAAHAAVLDILEYFRPSPSQSGAQKAVAAAVDRAAGERRSEKLRTAEGPAVAPPVVEGA